MISTSKVSASFKKNVCNAKNFVLERISKIKFFLMTKTQKNEKKKENFANNLVCN